MEEPQLKRSLGLFDVALFFVVAGSNLQWVATAGAAGASSLAVWLIGCLAMFVPIAVVVVFLSSHYPEEGGMYVWSKRAYGPFAGFMTGWTYWASNLPYFPALLYFAAGNALFVSGGGAALSASPWYFIAFAIAGLTLATVVNVVGLDVGKWLNNVGALARWAVTLLLIGLGAYAAVRFGSATHLGGNAVRPGLQIKDLIFWSVIAFAWTGPESLPFMAGEVRNPRRAIPVGLAIAAPAILIIYVLGTLSLLWTLTPSAINPSSGVMQAIASAASRAGWGALIPVAAVLVAVSCLGSCGAWLGAVARIPFVAGLDRFLPPAFGQMHPRWGSPFVALITQSAIAAVFIFLGQAGTSVRGAYDVLVSSTVVITMVPFVFLFASAFKLDAEPATPDMVRIPGGRWTVIACATIGLATTLGAMVLAVFPADEEPNKPFAVAKVLFLTAMMILFGVGFYIAGRARHSVTPRMTKP
jgi:amino acid transporter